MTQTHDLSTGDPSSVVARMDDQTWKQVLDAVTTQFGGPARAYLSHLRRHDPIPRPGDCGRTDDHFAHVIFGIDCPGVGAQVCDPERVMHLGPWERVPQFDSVQRCLACQHTIGK